MLDESLILHRQHICKRECSPCFCVNCQPEALVLRFEASINFPKRYMDQAGKESYYFENNPIIIWPHTLDMLQDATSNEPVLCHAHLPVFSVPSNQCSQVTSLAVFHHNVYGCVRAVNNSVIVSNNVWMFHLS